MFNEKKGSQKFPSIRILTTRIREYVSPVTQVSPVSLVWGLWSAKSECAEGFTIVTRRGVQLSYQSRFEERHPNSSHPVLGLYHIKNQVAVKKEITFHRHCFFGTSDNGHQYYWAQGFGHQRFPAKDSIFMDEVIAVENRKKICEE